MLGLFQQTAPIQAILAGVLFRTVFPLFLGIALSQNVRLQGCGRSSITSCFSSELCSFSKHSSRCESSTACNPNAQHLIHPRCRRSWLLRSFTSKTVTTLRCLVFFGNLIGKRSGISPTVWIRNDPEFQQWEAHELSHRFEEQLEKYNGRQENRKQPKVEVPDGHDLIHHWEHWQHEDHINAGRPFDLYLERELADFHTAYERMGAQRQPSGRVLRRISLRIQRQARPFTKQLCSQHFKTKTSAMRGQRKRKRCRSRRI